MQEDFLHYIWKHGKIDLNDIKTVDNKALEIKNFGLHNFNAGPDFFNAQLKIDGQLWAGNIEIHIKSSDWYVHNHEQNKAYDNVILHVVWEHDVDIFRKSNEPIPTLQLKSLISKSVLDNYNKLFSKSSKWISCENDFPSIDSFLLDNWLERLYFERLETKSISINQLLMESKNDWEEVLFKMLAKNFGLKVNGEAFLSIANSFDFSILRKLLSKAQSLEALFMGQGKMLKIDCQDHYFTELKEQYEFLKYKFQLTKEYTLPLQFFRLRPNNFPTIRLSQFANLYANESNLFSKVIGIKDMKGFYSLFSVAASQYWDTHYSFGISSKVYKKRLSKAFIDLLIVNTLIPLKFTYAKYKGERLDEEIINLIQCIPSEKNTIIDRFNNLKSVSHSGLQSQALLQLKNNYCSQNKCMQCAIGNAVLNRK